MIRVASYGVLFCDNIGGKTSDITYPFFCWKETTFLSFDLASIVLASEESSGVALDQGLASIALLGIVLRADHWLVEFTISVSTGQGVQTARAYWDALALGNTIPRPCGASSLLLGQLNWIH